MKTTILFILVLSFTFCLNAQNIPISKINDTTWVWKKANVITLMSILNDTTATYQYFKLEKTATTSSFDLKRFLKPQTKGDLK